MQRKKVGNKRFKILLGIFITFIILFFVLGFLVADKHAEHQHKVFSDIEALDILSPYITDEITEDKYLGEIVPVDRFTYKVKWNNASFSVYAYVFEDELQCMEYIDNREIPYYDNESFHLSGNIFFTSKYTVYSNNKCLYIDGPGEDTLMKFLDYIGQDFDIVI